MGDSINIDESTIQEWKNDLERITEGEVIKIISGEAFCDLYRELEGDFRRAILEHDANIKMIAGPIISIEDDTKSNAVLELADEGLLSLWISPYRQLNHFRLFDYRIVYFEDYHEALADKRSGQRSIDLISISRFNYEFDNLIESLRMPRYKEDENIIKVTKKDLISIKDSFGGLYDYISIDDLRSRVVELESKG